MRSKPHIIFKFLFFIAVLFIIHVKPSVGKEISSDKDSIFYQEMNASGFVSLDPQEALGVIIGAKDEKGMLTKEDTIYISIKRDYDVKIGDTFLIFNTSEKIKHPVSGKKFGYLNRIIGELQVSGIDGELFVAKIITTYDSISVGDKIMPLNSMDKRVLITKSDSEIKGYIIETQDQINNISQGCIVYVDKGEKDGVSRGNSFVIKKEGKKTYDHITKKDVILPSTIVGRGVILFTRPHTSTALITSGTCTLYVGDMITITNE